MSFIHLVQLRTDCCSSTSNFLDAKCHGWRINLSKTRSTVRPIDSVGSRRTSTFGPLCMLGRNAAASGSANTGLRIYNRSLFFWLIECLLLLTWPCRLEYDLIVANCREHESQTFHHSIRRGWFARAVGFTSLQRKWNKRNENEDRNT